MSYVEKKMNKDDLHAWKVYDNNQYALIPGISHKKHLSPESSTPVQGNANVTEPDLRKRHIGEDSVKKNYERMAKYGL
jgi:hypothetical protein